MRHRAQERHNESDSRDAFVIHYVIAFVIQILSRVLLHKVQGGEFHESGTQAVDYNRQETAVRCGTWHMTESARQRALLTLKIRT